MKHLKLTYYLLATITILGCLGSCSVEDDTTNSPTIEKKEVAASFSIQLNNNSANASRAIASTTEGTTTESTINSVILFIIDKASDDIIKVNANILPNTNNKQAVASLKISKGEKRIFVGINLSEGQANLFVENYQDGNATGNIGNISEVTTNGLVMFGQATTTSDDYNIEIAEGTYDYDIKANLTRIVSKIIVACELSNQEEKLLNVTNGYVKLDDVKYTISTTNKKFYFAEKADQSDPNYKLSEWLDNNGTPISGKYLITEFFYDKSDVFSTGKTAEAHTDDVKAYKNGFYCLENTVSNDINLTSAEAAQQVATCVHIVYKFTPSRIYQNGSESVLSYSDALTAMNNSVNGTFYIYNKAPKVDRNICYLSLDDLKNANKLASISTDDYTKYGNGHIERICFVNSVDFNNGASVMRNNYYILNLKSISLPIDNNSIEINTESVGWTIKGDTTIDFEPNM